MNSDQRIRHFPTNAGEPWGGSAAYIAVAPHVDLIKPLGRYLMWFQHGDNVIQPGSTLGGSVIESPNLPGLTTAWFSSGHVLDIDQSWPPEVFEQLDAFNHPRLREVSVVTIGPMFSPDTPKEVIRETFREDLQQLVKTRWLDTSSAFVREAFAGLEQLHQNPRAQLALKSRPQTQTEAAVASALNISLGIGISRPAR